MEIGHDAIAMVQANGLSGILLISVTTTLEPHNISYKVNPDITKSETSTTHTALVCKFINMQPHCTEQDIMIIILLMWRFKISIARKFLVYHKYHVRLDEIMTCDTKM